MVEDTVEYRIYYRIIGDPDEVQHTTYPFIEEYITTNYEKFLKHDGLYDVKIVKETIIKEIIQPAFIH